MTSVGHWVRQPRASSSVSSGPCRCSGLTWMPGRIPCASANRSTSARAGAISVASSDRAGVSALLLRPRSRPGVARSTQPFGVGSLIVAGQAVKAWASRRRMSASGAVGIRGSRTLAACPLRIL